MRSMMHVYAKGSAEALEYYLNAFDARLACSYPNERGEIMHSEFVVCGQTFALAEATAGFGAEAALTARFGACLSDGAAGCPGNAMQFCLQYGEGGEAAVARAYEALREGATIIDPLGPVEYSALQFVLIDRYGVHWCVFV